MTITTFLFTLFLLSAACLVHVDAKISKSHTQFKIISGVCPSKNPPLAKVGDSCGIPDFVDPKVFGDNMDTTGNMFISQGRQGLNLHIELDNLPKPDLVLTAWIIWTPFGDTEPPVFKVANHASPCAPYTAPFSTGLNHEPNQLRYVSHNKAVFSVGLNFNPTFPHQGALTRETFCFQKDVVGIQRTKLQQFTTPDGTFIPTSSSYLRQYDPKTGFEKLDKIGKPLVVPSPVKSLGIEVIAHVDKTTHGISQGVGGVDHYFVIFFPFEDSYGSPSYGFY